MKRIVFASGKGGTGKTTFTAAIASVAAAESPIVLADCDVEAANLPVAFAVEAVHAEPFGGGSKAFIDSAACTGCGACASACRFDAVSAPENPYRDRAFTIDSYACEGCRVCVGSCPAKAIRMEPVQAGELLEGMTSVGPIAFGSLYPGEDLSGKLVTEVRTRAEARARETGAGFVVIDGPPGVGCPATAAITNTDLIVAVTEPTLSGEHDLMRLVTLARRLDVPVAVVLNKADLSASGAARITSRIASEGMPLIAEVPFDPTFGTALARLAHGGRFALEGPIADLAAVIWSDIRSRLGQ